MEILFADDQKGFVELLKSSSHFKRHNIDIVYSGKSALELIKLNKYDLVFLDYNMPEFTGLELIKYIKENNLKAKTVLFTGDPSINYFIAKDIGADEYWAKPLKIARIEEIIDKYSVD